jgi:hypothetical protein
MLTQTWGLAQSWFIPDYTNWSNVDFERAKAAVTAPLPNNTQQADYFTQTQSWHEQRNFVYNAVDSIRESTPALAAAIDAEFAILADVKTPVTSGFTKVPTTLSGTGSVLTLTCGSATIGFDATTGAIVQLRAGMGSKEWANSSNPIGQ